MGGLLLFEGEELVVRFRPHPVWYVPRYLSALGWLAAAALSALAATLLVPDFVLTAGLSALVVVSLVAALVVGRVLKKDWMFSAFVALACGALLAVQALHLLPLGPDMLVLVVLGAALALLRIGLHEYDRVSRAHFLTTERLVIRGGVRAREDRTISLRKIQEVRTERPMMTRPFDVGHAILVLSRSVRGGKEPVVHEDKEVLRGIGHLTEIQHHLAQLSEESRMPQKDRRRRLEERRVKDSMRRLAGWMRSGRGERGQA
jgi:hypothetical protein